MSSPDAVFPLPPPVFKFPIGYVVDGQVYFNQVGIDTFTKLWAGIQGQGGVYPSVSAIYAMTGDGTLTPSGTATLLRVTATGGVPFGFFATGTDASHLSGTVPLASMPYAVSFGLVLVGTGSGLLQTEDAQVTTVAALPAQPYRQGARRFVSDSSVAAASNFGNVVAGGGTSGVPVYSDGADWRIG